MGGMEYPTLFTGDTSWYEPTHITELTAEHEFGHQYWYGMVATNEFEDAWLDEGINSYTEVKVLAAILGPYNSVFDRPYANAGDFELQRYEYLGKPDYDPVTRWAFKFRNATSYGDITYGKSSTLLATLEGIIGTEHHGRGHAHLLPALPLHPPHHRRLPPHHRRSSHRARQSDQHHPLIAWPKAPLHPRRSRNE